MKNFFKKLGHAVCGRKGIGTSMTVAIILAVVMLNIVAYTVTNVFSLYIYSEEKDDLSISGNTDELFENAQMLGKKVTITFCYPEDTLKNHSTGSFVLATARAFEERYEGFVELRFVNLLTKMQMDENGNFVKFFDFDQYYEIICPHCKNNVKLREIDRSDAECTKCKESLSDEDLEKITTPLRSNSVIFESGEGPDFNFRILTDTSTSAGFVDFYILDGSSSIVSYNGEEVMAAMMLWVVSGSHDDKVVYFTQNHGESADIAFSNLLTCAGYRIEVINLRKEAKIPDNAALVVISNPTSDFDRTNENDVKQGEINKLEDYLERGGKLYVALDPYVKELKNLESLLGNWGIGMSFVRDENGTLLRNVVKEGANAITTDGYTFVATHADNEISSQILDKVQRFGTDRVLMSNVVALDLNESPNESTKVYPILQAGDTASTYAGGKLTDNNGGYDVAALSVKTLEDGSTASVFVIPTAYITATDAFISEGYSNKDFLYATFEVAFGSYAAPYGCNQVIYETQILENLTMGTAKAYTALILAIPAALAIVGTVIIVRRKNR